MRRRAVPFKIKVEETTNDSMEFMELRITKNLKRKRYDLGAREKFQPLHVPLSHDSCHHPSIHSWPAAMLQRRLNYVSTAALCEEALQDMHKRFEFNDASQAHHNLLDLGFKSFHKNTFKNTEKISNSKIWWLPIPHHPCWRAANFQKEANNFLPIG